MRIRKNAEKLVERKSSYLICQLNRTPWDDSSFLSQGYWDNDLPLTNNVNYTAPASDSIPSGESMEYSHSPEKGGDDDEIGGGDGIPTMLPPGPPPLPPKKVTGPTATSNGVSIVPKKRGRPRKPVHGASFGNNSNSNNNESNNNNNMNPYEFYYYSGFGPSWGKRRGGTRLDHTPDDPSNSIGNGNGNGNETPGCSSTTRESNVSEDDEIMITDDGENKGNNKSVMESFDSVLAAERELDYIDDEEDEDEDEMFGGKRARKPIKARSLKSLM